jgi:hypothetical protein
MPSVGCVARREWLETATGLARTPLVPLKDPGGRVPVCGERTARMRYTSASTWPCWRGGASGLVDACVDPAYRRPRGIWGTKSIFVFRTDPDSTERCCYVRRCCKMQRDEGHVCPALDADQDTVPPVLDDPTVLHQSPPRSSNMFVWLVADV